MATEADQSTLTMDGGGFVVLCGSHLTACGAMANAECVVWFDL